MAETHPAPCVAAVIDRCVVCCGRYIESGLANYVRVDICNVGGFTEAMKVAGWAEAHCTPRPPARPLVAVGVPGLGSGKG